MSSSTTTITSPSSSGTNLVGTWLQGIGLDYAIQTFEDAGIVTPTALAELDVSFFHALGITHADDRRKLFYLVQRIKMQLETTGTNNTPTKNNNNKNTTTSTTDSHCNSTTTTALSSATSVSAGGTGATTKPMTTAKQQQQQQQQTATVGMTTSSYGSSHGNSSSNDDMDQPIVGGGGTSSSAAAGFGTTMSPRRRAILEGRRLHLQQQQQQQNPNSQQASSSSTATTLKAATSSPVAAIKTRMRRLESTRQNRTIQQQQHPSSIIEEASTEGTGSKSSTINTATSAGQKQAPPMTGGDYSSEDQFFDSVEEVDELHRYHNSSNNPETKINGNDDEDDDGFWDSHDDDEDEDANAQKNRFVSPSKKRNNNSKNKGTTRNRIKSSNDDENNNDDFDEFLDESVEQSAASGAGLGSVVSNTRRSQRVLDKVQQKQQQQQLETTKSNDSIQTNTSRSTAGNSSSRASHVDRKSRRESSSSVGKINMTADELLEQTLNDSFANSAVNDSFSSTASTTKATSSSRQQQPARRSNLQAPSRRASDTTRTSALAKPSKSIRTGKQLSAVPANDILPMSPLLNILPQQLIEPDDDNLDDEKSGAEVKQNVTTRRRGGRRSGIQPGRTSTSTRSHPKLERSMSYDSALVSDDGDDESYAGSETGSGISDVDNNFRNNNNNTSMSDDNLSTSQRSQGKSSHRRPSIGSTNRRSSLERPRSLSTRRLGSTGGGGGGATKTSTITPTNNNNIVDTTGINAIATREEDTNNDETRNDRRRESFQGTSRGVTRSRSMSRSRRSYGGTTTDTTSIMGGTNSLHANAAMNRSTSTLLESNIPPAANPASVGNNTSTISVSYQGQKEDDSFKAQIRAIREDVDADYELFADEMQRRKDGDNGAFVDADDPDMRIRVVIRKRPMTRSEIASAGDIDIIHPLDYNQFGKILVYQPKTRVDLTKEIETIPFAFDNVFNETQSNVDIYQRSVRHMIPSFFQGQWTSIFAYGQTGSGKTYTMMGCNMTGIRDGSSNPDDFSNLGLYYMAALDIFHALQLPEYNALTLGVSMFEIYAGKLFDLLNDRHAVKCLEDAKGKVCFPGLSEHGVLNPDDLISLIEKGAQNRSTGTTSRNADSSRSHAVLQLHLRKQKQKSTISTASSTTARTTAAQRASAAAIRRSGINSSSASSNASSTEFSRLTFIDLAGSERGADTQSASRATRLEGAEINTSLLALKEVIRALAKNDQSALAHVPFRGSKLTQVLKESFVGKHSKCVMIACISPNIINCEQTLNTLRYADRVKERNPDTGYLSSVPSSSNTISNIGPSAPATTSAASTTATTNTKSNASTKVAASSNAYKMLSEQFSQSSLFGQSQSNNHNTRNNDDPNARRKQSNDTGNDTDDFDEFLDDITPNRSHHGGNKNQTGLSTSTTVRSSSQQRQVEAKSMGSSRNNTQETRSKGTDDYLFDDDDDDDDDLLLDDDNGRGKQQAQARQKSFEQTGRSLLSPSSDARVKKKQDSFGHRKVSSNNSMSSNSSDMLDALLATPRDGIFRDVHTRNSLEDNLINDDTDNDDQEFDDLASHYYSKENVGGRNSRNVRSTIASTKSQDSKRPPSRHSLASAMTTPSTTAKRLQEQQQHQHLENEQTIISGDLIALHKQALSSMLKMIKDEMVLVNSADTDRELFLNDYVTQVQGVHEKQLEWIALLREHLLKYRIIANATDAAAASSRKLQQQLTPGNNRKHTGGQDDDSFEDLRD